MKFSDYWRWTEDEDYTVFEYNLDVQYLQYGS